MAQTLERNAIHPDKWACPKCKKVHDKPHWKDHHQKEPNWKGKLGDHDWDKGSNPDYEVVCEVCGEPLKENPEAKGEPFWCENCDGFRNVPGQNPEFCYVCGEELTEKTAAIVNYCAECKAERLGVPAGLFCPHCGWSESDERVLLVRA